MYEFKEYTITEEEKAIMDKVYSDLAKAEKEVAFKNRKTIIEASSMMSKSFKKYLKRVISENEIGGYNSCYMTYEIVAQPKGEYQTEDGFGSITGYYVDQRCTSMEGDSFAGTITVVLAKGKYLQMPFEC